jgi:hypothetical protein
MQPPNIVYQVAGVRAAHGVKTSIYLISRVPNAVALATGLTIEVTFSFPTNANNSDFSGTKAYLDVVAGIVTSGTTTADDSAFGAVAPIAAQTVTMPTSTSTGPGTLFIQSFVLANTTNISGSLAAGSTVFIRVRRLGDNASDTLLGDIHIVNVDFRNT